MNRSLATSKKNGESKENDWLLQFNNAFLLDSFNDYRGQFKNYLMSISHPFIGAV